MGEICHVMSRDVTLLTCRQKIIVKVNIMGEILSRDVTLLTCRQKNNSENEYYGRDLLTCRQTMSAKDNSESEYYGRDLVT